MWRSPMVSLLTIIRYYCNPGVGSAERSLGGCDGIRLQSKVKGPLPERLGEQARLSVAVSSDWV
jgi:hypothetical protein